MIEKGNKAHDFKLNNSNHILSKNNYIHIPINKDGNCFLAQLAFT